MLQLIAATILWPKYAIAIEPLVAARGQVAVEETAVPKGYDWILPFRSSAGQIHVFQSDVLLWQRDRFLKGVMSIASGDRILHLEYRTRPRLEMTKLDELLRDGNSVAATFDYISLISGVLSQELPQSVRAGLIAIDPNRSGLRDFAITMGLLSENQLQQELIAWRTDQTDHTLVDVLICPAKSALDLHSRDRCLYVAISESFVHWVEYRADRLIGDPIFRGKIIAGMTELERPGFELRDEHETAAKMIVELGDSSFAVPPGFVTEYYKYHPTGQRADTLMMRLEVDHRSGDITFANPMRGRSDEVDSSSAVVLLALRSTPDINNHSSTLPNIKLDFGCRESEDGIDGYWRYCTSKIPVGDKVDVELMYSTVYKFDPAVMNQAIVKFIKELTS